VACNQASCACCCASSCVRFSVSFARQKADELSTITGTSSCQLTKILSDKHNKTEKDHVQGNQLYLQEAFPHMFYIKTEAVQCPRALSRSTAI